MPRNQLLGKAKHKRSADAEDSSLRKTDIKESAFRPAAKRTSQSNRLRDALEQQKVHKQNELHHGLLYRTKVLIFYIFSPVEGENFEPKNPWIMHPTSIASSTILVISGTLLIYSAIQVPLDIGFYWNFEVCQTDPILVNFNVFVDTFFLFEVIANFFVGVWHKGQYVEDVLTIGLIYLKGRLLFDLITSVPTSWFELMAYRVCGKQDAGPVTSSAVADTIRFLRLLKPLRLTKLLRIIKFAKIFDVLDRVLRISPQVIQIAKLIFGVTLLVHFLACIFWLMKTEYDPEFVSFMENFDVTEGVAKKWLLSMYFVNTVFTTVGFGDISGTNNIERVFCIVVMWVGTAVFAVIINKLQRAAAEMNERNREKNAEVQKVVRFMREHKTPAWMEQEVRTWLNFHIDRMTAKRERAQVLNTLPPKLRNQVVLQINSRAFSGSWVFGRLTHNDSTKLVTELVLHTENHIIAKGQLIASDRTNCALPSLHRFVENEPESEHDDAQAKHSDFVVERAEHSSLRRTLSVSPARADLIIARPPSQGTARDGEGNEKGRPEDKMMYIVEVGAVVATVWLKGKDKMIESRTLTKGHYFGERRLLLDSDESTGGWGFYEDVEFEFRAIENSEIITLTKKIFDSVMQDFPPALYDEIRFEAGRLWGAADPIIEDLRLRIELDLVGEVGEYAKSRRARLRWESLAFQLYSNTTHDQAMGNVLFNFSLPSRTADPTAMLRERPDWSQGSLRSSRRGSQMWRPNSRSVPQPFGRTASHTRSKSKTSSVRSQAELSNRTSSLQAHEEANDPGSSGPGAEPVSNVASVDSAPKSWVVEVDEEAIEDRRRSLLPGKAVSPGGARTSRSREDASPRQPDSGRVPVLSANLVMVDAPSPSLNARSKADTTNTTPMRLST